MPPPRSPSAGADVPGDATGVAPAWLVAALAAVGDYDPPPPVPEEVWGILESAVRLAAHGIPTLPVLISRKPGQPKGHSPWRKIPAVRRGVHGASIDPRTLAWVIRDACHRARSEPDTTVALAIALGVESPELGYLVAVDVDRKGGRDELEARFGPLPLAGLVETPSGGIHAYLWAPRPVRNAAKLAGVPGVELRGSGLYCVCDGRTPDGSAWRRHWDDPRTLPPVPEAWLPALLGGGEPVPARRSIGARNARSAPISTALSGRGRREGEVASPPRTPCAEDDGAAMGLLDALLAAPIAGPHGDILVPRPGKPCPESVSGPATYAAVLWQRRDPLIASRHEEVLRSGHMAGHLLRDEGVDPRAAFRHFLETEVWSSLVREDSSSGGVSRAHDEVRSWVDGLRYAAALPREAFREREARRATQAWRRAKASA